MSTTFGTMFGNTLDTPLSSSIGLLLFSLPVYSYALLTTTFPVSIKSQIAPTEIINNNNYDYHLDHNNINTTILITITGNFNIISDRDLDGNYIHNINNIIYCVLLSLLSTLILSTTS